MSLSSVHGSLSSLRSFQADIGTGMDIVTDVAMDLVEAQDAGVTEELQTLQDLMLDSARLEREINTFVDVVSQVTTQAVSQEPDSLRHLLDEVKEKFEEKSSRLSEAGLQSHPKVVTFKESVRATGQADQEHEDMEEFDADIVVAHSQVNFTCPLTQVDMENPVKNRKCNHMYDEAAILSLIRTRRSQKKKCRCPVVGCGNLDVNVSDLVPDPVLKRKILISQKKN